MLQSDAQRPRHRAERISSRRLRRTGALAVVFATVTAPLSVVTAMADTSSPDTTATTFLSDSMDRTADAGWGGVWSFTDAGDSHVQSSTGTLDLPRGVSRQATVKDSSVLDSSTLVRLQLSELPASGMGTWFAVFTRQVDGHSYQQRLRVGPDGDVHLSTVRVDGAADRLARLGEVELPFTVAAGETLYLRTQVQGTDDVTLASRLFKASDTEPSWQLVVHDTSDERLDAAGGYGLWGYTSTGSQSNAVEIDGVRAARLVSAPVAPVSPVPTPSASATAPAPTPSASTTTPAPTPSASTATPAPTPSPSTIVPMPTPTTTAPAPTPSTTTPAPTPTTTAPRPSPTTTPEPTASTTTPAPIISVSVGSSGRPSEGSTGVPAGVKLTRSDGDMTITTPGTVIDGLDIHGFVSIKAPNVTIKNSIIRGGTATRQTSLITSTAPNALITDSELVPEHPSVDIDGLKGYGFTARRLDVHGVVDSVLIWGDDTTVESSWLHANVHYASDPQQDGGPSHDDNIQVQGGDNIRITGNATDGAYNSALQITQDSAQTSNLLYAGNWVGGGGCSVNVAEKGKGPIQGLIIKQNRFDHTSRLDCPVIVPDTTPVSFGDNLWSDSLLPIVVRLN